MKKRVISAIIMCIIVIPLFIIGGVVFKIGVSFLSLLAYKELVSLKRVNKKINLPILIFGLISLLGIIFIVNDTYALYLGVSYQAICMTILLMLIPTIFKKDYLTEDALYLVGFIMLLGIFFNSVLLIMDQNKMLLLYLLVIVCTTDSFAYIVGRMIGKHHFSPISPNKTIEGCIAGTLFGCVISTFFYLAIFNGANVFRVILLTLILSISGQLGDLFFSKIKRENDIKDFSNLIPGHGGILDRIDSLVFATLTYVALLTVI